MYPALLERRITHTAEHTMAEFLHTAWTFDDILLQPGYSEVTPDMVDVSAWLTPAIRLRIPVLSSAMDTVTESAMAISLARAGGIGIVHKNMSIDRQRLEVEKVKKSESGMIVDPVTIRPSDTVNTALELMRSYRVSGLPVVEHDRLVGILTNRDVRFVEDLAGTLVQEVMTRDHLVTVPAGTTLEEAKFHLHKHRIEKLLVVDGNNRLIGLITMKDIDKVQRYPDACKDDKGRLRVGAALAPSPDCESRAEGLLASGADVLVLDSAHGHSLNVLNAVRTIRGAFPGCQLIAGNVATYEGAVALLEAGADAVKVGIGPGSICTTRVVAGVGVPQITAITDGARAARELDKCCVADGGIKFSGDLVKALAVGAHSVMIGSLLAGTDESPGETILYQGRTYKIYRGMGSIDAMKEGSADRYFQETSKKLVPEGIVGRVPYRGPAADTIYQLVGGLKSGMGYCGAQDIPALYATARLGQVSASGLRESHVHDVIITKEAPNYRIDNA
jgi:IMP dehydrogenase